MLWTNLNYRPFRWHWNDKTIVTSPDDTRECDICTARGCDARMCNYRETQHDGTNTQLAPTPTSSVCMDDVWFLVLGANPPPLSSLPSSFALKVGPPSLRPLPCPSLPSFVPDSLRSRPLNPATGSGERCKLPQWGLGRNRSLNRIPCILAVKYDFRWQQQH